VPGCFKLSNHGASAGSGLSGGAASLAHHGAAAASLWRVSETALHEQLFAQRFPAREPREAPTRMIVSRLERHSSRKVQSGQRRAIRIMLLDRFLKLSQGAIILPRGPLPQGAGLFLTTLCAVRSNEVGRSASTRIVERSRLEGEPGLSHIAEPCRYERCISNRHQFASEALQ